MYTVNQTKERRKRKNRKDTQHITSRRIRKNSLFKCLFCSSSSLDNVFLEGTSESTFSFVGGAGAERNFSKIDDKNEKEKRFGGAARCSVGAIGGESKGSGSGIGCTFWGVVLRAASGGLRGVVTLFCGVVLWLILDLLFGEFVGAMFSLLSNRSLPLL